MLGGVLPTLLISECRRISRGFPAMYPHTIVGEVRGALSFLGADIDAVCLYLGQRPHRANGQDARGLDAPTSNLCNNGGAKAQALLLWHSTTVSTRR